MTNPHMPHANQAALRLEVRVMTLVEPDGNAGWLHSCGGDCLQFALQIAELELISQTVSESLHGPCGVVPRTVEAAFNPFLHSPTER